jgi:hypothetical protein
MKARNLSQTAQDIVDKRLPLDQLPKRLQANVAKLLSTGAIQPTPTDLPVRNRTDRMTATHSAHSIPSPRTATRGRPKRAS